MEALTTMCYLDRDGKRLMLHRTKKHNDFNEGKWLGIGGHFEAGESPEDCILREFREETGLTLTSFRFRAIITFLDGNGYTEYMHLFTADAFEGTPIECTEGDLVWVPIDEVPTLSLWEGDLIFLRLLKERDDFFSLKLLYDGSEHLSRAWVDGREIPLCAKEAAASLR